ncbi:hypothetical protein LSH36_512g02045 [Paralvinella palmiformis]|uniref:Transcription initiation factor IIA subunit 1 n=1 Tax=Paralvinella palmiformis TaxID=53620 RepID=A0AAD9J8B8_9ANNE|nr:hypothetical protein LSH36_512g02045 [Paralvinella palmiformis]
MGVDFHVLRVHEFFEKVLEFDIGRSLKVMEFEMSKCPKLYRSVIDDVINNVREAFLDDGVDEQVLLELKKLWEDKLIQSKVLETEKPMPHILNINAAGQQQLQIGQAGSVTQQQAAKQAQPQAAAFSAHIPVINAGQTGLIEMSGAAQTATLALPPSLYQQQLAALQGGTISLAPGGAQYIIQAAATGQIIQASQPTAVTTSAISASAHSNTTEQQNVQRIVQLDGTHDSSSDDDDDEEEDGDKDDDDDDVDLNDDENEEQGKEEDPLNSCDDVSSDEDPAQVFDTENVVVCQFDRVNRNKNKWKFSLKDGIMNLNGKDYVFQKATGDAEW